MSTHFPPLERTLAQNLQQIRSSLAKQDCQAMARQSGFLKRTPRKIPIPDFLLGLVSLAAQTTLTHELAASVISLVAGLPYTKQAFQKRLNATIESFLIQVAMALFNDLGKEVRAAGMFSAFNRVLLHDSTVESLPENLAPFFPGNRNQRKKKRACLKIQLTVDLLNSTLVDSCLSGYTRNDQAAATDILPLLRRGDLVLRDLGYFALPVLDAIDLAGAYYLSRFRHGVGAYTLEGQPLNLAEALKNRGHIDQEVLLGAQRVRVRLVAKPVPETVANQRRRRAKTSRDTRCTPTTEHLFLMGWNIFVTNVSRQVWPAKALFPIYRLRWRIEMIFKAWKSHLGLRQMNTHSAALLRLSVLTKLIFCLLVYGLCHALELLGNGKRHVSLSRLAKILSQCACLFAAEILQITPQRWLEHQLEKHVFYEKRKDRKNYYQLLAQLVPSLG